MVKKTYRKHKEGSQEFETTLLFPCFYIPVFMIETPLQVCFSFLSFSGIYINRLGGWISSLVHRILIPLMPNNQLVPASQIERGYEQKVQMRVPMYSKGDELKIRNALRHYKGSRIDIEFNQQKVTVTGLVNRHEVLAAIKAKRKNSQFWPAEDGKEDLGTSGAKKGEIMKDANRPAAASKKKKEVTFPDQQGAKKSGIMKDAKKPAASSKKKKKVTFADQQ